MTPETPTLDPESAVVAAESCFVRVNGDPVKVTPLDCEAPATWTLMCALSGLPEGGKLSVRASVDDFGLVAEARLPFSGQGQFEIPLVAPSGGGLLRLVRVGGAPAAGMLGLPQLCPADPPGDAQGRRVITPLVLEILHHPATGFAEETLAGGVTNRVPTYGAGTVVSTVDVAVAQRLVLNSKAGTQPLASAPRVDRPVKGRMMVSDGRGGWAGLDLGGRRVDVALSGGDVHLLVLDLKREQLDPIAGGDALAWLQADLDRWLAGDDTAVLGLVGYAQSDVARPVRPNWRGGASASGLQGVTERVEIGILRTAAGYRVSLAWRAGPFDGTSRTALAEALAEG